MSDPERRRILVVDDDASARDGLQRLFTQEGYDAVVAADGLSALALVDEHAPDVVVTDLKMPGMDGMELLATLKEQPSQIPVLVATVLEDVTSAVNAIHAGAEDYVTKPVDFDALLKLVERAIERRERRRQGRAR